MNIIKQTLILSGILIAPALIAQEPVKTLEKQIVTADLRDETLQTEISTSISVIDSETIEKAGSQHFEDILSLVPNLNWSAGSNRPRYFQIRGIGERSQYEGAPNPSVGFIVDDIDFSALGGVATLFDVEQIEVLRGPQGTRYGANGLAGLIYVKTFDPEFDDSYKFESLIGDDGDRSLGFRATGDLSDNSAYRFSIHQYNANGFRDNDFFNSDDTNERDEFVARGKVHWHNNNDLNINVSILKADINNGYDAFAPENTFVVHSDKPGRDDQESTGLGMKIQKGLNNFDFVSITSYMKADIFYSFDGDWGNDEYWGEYAPYDFTSDTDRDRSHLSQEFRLLSNEGSRLFNGSTDWLVGLYYLDMSEDNNIIDLYNGFIDRELSSQFDSESIALFAQFDHRLSEKNTLSTGIRFETKRANYTDSNGIDVSPTDNMWGGQLSLNHAISQNFNSYVTLSRGYKAGGFNLSLSVPDNLREYQPESLLNIEAGLKGYLLDYNLHWNASVFYSKREDMQISTSRQEDPNDPLTFVYLTSNAATGSNYGLETNFNYQINQSFAFYGSLGLLNAEFDDFITAEGNFNGRDQAHAPNYTFSLGAEYKHLNGFFVRFDANGKDSFYFSDSHDQQSKSYQTFNLRLGYQANAWKVTLWGNNIFNKTYATRGFFFGLEPPNYESTQYVQLGAPRHMGVSFDYEF